MSTDVKSLNLFDANCMLGRTIAPKAGFPLAVDELLEVMDHFEIAEALVYHAMGKEFHPADGNLVLLDEIAQSDRLHPMWVVMPSHTGELPDEETLVGQMLSKNVRAARVFPHADCHNFSLRQWGSGKLLRALETARIPLFVDQEQIDWDALHDLCRHHPELPLVITSLGYRLDRLLYPLCERFNNLHVELSSYCGHRGIEDLTERFGAERLLFGTRLPHFTPGSAVAVLSYAGISQTDKRLIAGDNLRNLLRRAGTG